MQELPQALRRRTLADIRVGDVKLLILSKYGSQAASTRYRLLQYLPYLEKAGIECTVSPLFDDAYLVKKYRTGRAPLAEVSAAFARRTVALLGARRFDLTLIAYECFPYLPPFFEAMLWAQRMPYVLDYDDAIFHNYDQHPNGLVRALLGRKLEPIIRRAAWTFAGSGYLLDYVRRFTERVELLPTVIDLEQYPRLKDDSGSDPLFTIGWLGSPATAPYLSSAMEPLTAFCARHPSRVVLVGSGPVKATGLPLEVRPWSDATERKELLEFDVGVMPLPDTPFSRGKCGFKLIQYMASGLPVIASPVGENRKIVVEGENGFLAETPEDWLHALEALRQSPRLRQQMGHAGRRRVEAEYCVQVTSARMVSRLLRLPEMPTWRR